MLQTIWTLGSSLLWVHIILFVFLNSRLKCTWLYAADIFRTPKIMAGQGLTLRAPITTAADDKFCDIFPYFWKKIRYDISWESSASRRFSRNIMPGLLFLKKQQNLKLSSAAKCRWRFNGLFKPHSVLIEDKFTKQSRDKMPLYFKTITVVKLHIWTLSDLLSK